MKNKTKTLRDIHTQAERLKCQCNGNDARFGYIRQTALVYMDNALSYIGKTHDTEQFTSGDIDLSDIPVEKWIYRGMNEYRELYKQSKDCVFYEFTKLNHKSERIVFELTKCENPKCKDSLPNLWYKHRYTKKVLQTWWSMRTYVHDKDGNCYAKYNPQVYRNCTWINFDYMFEATEENKMKLINALAERAFREDNE